MSVLLQYLHSSVLLNSLDCLSLLLHAVSSQCYHPALSCFSVTTTYCVVLVLLHSKDPKMRKKIVCFFATTLVFLRFSLYYIFLYVFTFFLCFSSLFFLFLSFSWLFLAGSFFMSSVFYNI